MANHMENNAKGLNMEIKFGNVDMPIDRFDPHRVRTEYTPCVYRQPPSPSNIQHSYIPHVPSRHISSLHHEAGILYRFSMLLPA